MAVVVEDKVVKSTCQDLNIPDVDAAEFFVEKFRTFEDRTALVDYATGSTFTYSELEDVGHRVGAGLQRLGFQPGQRTGIHSGNSHDCLLAVLGTILAGGTLVFAKAALTPRELRYQFEDAQPDVVFCDQANASKTLETCKFIPSVKTLVVFGSHDGFVSFGKLKCCSRSDFFPVPKRDAGDALVIMYSSGTTGLPKGVLISNENFIIMCLLPSHESVQCASRDDVYLCAAPLMHLSGLWSTCFFFATGSCVLLLTAPEPELVFPAIEKYKTTTMITFPTVAHKLLQSPLIDAHDIGSMKEIIIGGSPMPSVVAKRLIAKFNIGYFRQGYGMTETSGMVTITPPNHCEHGNVGKPVPLCQVKVVDVENGEKLGPYKHGELRVKGPGCVQGYLNMPKGATDLYDAEGFLKTGDLGYYDEQGSFYIVDRMKALIKCMDQQVAPAELEDLLLQHWAVKDAAVAGVPHKEYGEAPRAFLVLDPAAAGKVTEGELSRIVAENLAPHKHLYGGVEFVESIPKLDTGKNLRRALRDAYIRANC
ncbi:luciferin 4-monooxygenase-like [Ornithodoros turicata]|uniref:luciferin 4-monooxygenase-like n=1 Tax=Ornithodoros turicata TaxID=34597 RepID=UPI003139EDEE